MSGNLSLRAKTGQAALREGAGGDPWGPALTWHSALRRYVTGGRPADGSGPTQRGCVLRPSPGHLALQSLKDVI